MNKICKLFFTFYYLILLLLLINSCSNARYTGLKSYRYSDEEIPNIQQQKIPDTTKIINKNSNLNQNEKDYLYEHENRKEKKETIRNSESPFPKSHIKVKKPKASQAPKYNILTSTFVVNALLIWIVGFLVIGIGSVMHIFIGVAVALSVLSIIKK